MSRQGQWPGRRSTIPDANCNPHLKPPGYPGIVVAMDDRFPWLTQIHCGCKFSRVQLTTGETVQHWDPCGTHIVLAATGHQPEGWPPRIRDTADHPVTTVV